MLHVDMRMRDRHHLAALACVCRRERGDARQWHALLPADREIRQTARERRATPSPESGPGDRCLALDVCRSSRICVSRSEERVAWRETDRLLSPADVRFTRHFGARFYVHASVVRLRVLRWMGVVLFVPHVGSLRQLGFLRDAQPLLARMRRSGGVSLRA